MLGDSWGAHELDDNKHMVDHDKMVAELFGAKVLVKNDLIAGCIHL